uniref:FecR family protein n=1 Tax=Pedobacter schmidteae TaxID=2201271 RepID=UPI000EAC5AC0|nr:FecR domain-containing protein [Pedobacter schmidteae]
MQNKRKFTNAFRRLFRKKADRQEMAFFARWFTGLDLSEDQVFRDRTEEEEIGKKIERNLYEYIFSQPKEEKPRHQLWWLSATVAASVIIAIVGLQWFMSPKTKDQVILSRILTGKGQRKIITLADGSTVSLNSASQLSFPKSFTDSVREVFLEGEAFFEIAHNKLKPFVVKTGVLNIRVLGTTFNVRHYLADKTIGVVVATGKVGVGKGDSTISTLVPGDYLAYDVASGTSAKSVVDPNEYTGWQKGELVFKNETLSQICKRLERWYDVDITIKTSSLNSKRITLKQKNESLATVLKMLGMVGGFEYKIKDRTVEIW